MSRSNPRMTNPVKKYISLSGKTGAFNYWDRESQTEVALPYPVSFLPLDVLSTIRGFSSVRQVGIYSNEVHNISKEPLYVRVKGKEKIAEGLYKDIKEHIKAYGGKFCRAVYALMYFNGAPEIVIIYFTGASLNSWIELENTYSIYDIAVNITGSVPAQRGITNYFIPTLVPISVSPESAAIAVELDKKLQVYLTEKNEIKAVEAAANDKIQEEEDGGENIAPVPDAVKPNVSVLPVFGQPNTAPPYIVPPNAVPAAPGQSVAPFVPIPAVPGVTPVPSPVPAYVSPIPNYQVPESEPDPEE